MNKIRLTSSSLYRSQFVFLIAIWLSNDLKTSRRLDMISQICCDLCTPRFSVEVFNIWIKIVNNRNQNQRRLYSNFCKGFNEILYRVCFFFYKILFGIRWKNDNPPIQRPDNFWEESKHKNIRFSFLSVKKSDDINLISIWFY